MTPTEIALIVFACMFGGTLAGMFLQTVMPQHHLNEDSKDVIKLGMGLIGTITALVLGLVIATAKTSYDTLDAAVKHTAAKIVMLDRSLAQYGPETKETRDLLRRILANKIDEVWPEERSQPAGSDTPELLPKVAVEDLEYRLRQLASGNDAQSWLRSRALQICGEIMETRWLITGSAGSSVPLPFLIVVVFWLTVIFGSFGLLAPRNATVIMVLFVSALSVACAMFLILEMDQPFKGLMKISSAPLRFTLSHLGQ
ncbi:MAG: hypothetical protein ABFD97_17150 [Syntrophobacter sp.]